MKYIAPLAPAGTRESAADDLDDFRIVELSGADYDVIRTGSRRWIGVLIAIAAAITGFGFVSHGSEAALLGPVRAPSEVGIVESVSPASRVGPIPTDRAAQELEAQELVAQPVVVTTPAEGATVTSSVTMTGGVVVVDAAARRALGPVHVSVSIGELVLGSRDVEVEAIGPFQVRIPLFPPPFDAPVVLRMQAPESAGRARFDVSREFHLAIPSAVGFWDASATGLVDADGHLQMRILGYGPLSARSVDLAIRDARGHDVARGPVRLAVDGDLPNAMAGRILGLGSFDATFWLPPDPDRELSLVATWRDAATGARIHMETTLSPVGGGRR